MHPDLRITGKHYGSYREPMVAYFDVDSATLDPEEQKKLTELGRTVAPDAPITIEAYVSEDEGALPGATPALLQASRAANVLDALRAGGWAGPATVSGRPNTGPDAEFRSVRRVQVRPPKAVIARDAAAPDHQPAPAQVHQALADALPRVRTALALIRQGHYAALDAVNRFFPKVEPKRVADNLELIARHLDGLPEAGPGNPTLRPAFRYVARSVGLAATSGSGKRALITFGAQMCTDPPLESIATVIHEASHAAGGLVTGDVSYTDGRLFPHLYGDSALSNADSYAFCVLAITDPAHTPKQPKGDHYDPTFSATQVHDLSDTIAFLEAFLVHARQDVRRLYRHAWSRLYQNVEWPGGYYDRQLAVVSTTFAPAIHQPIQPQDEQNLAGIFDRLTDLVDAVRNERLRFVPGGVTRWALYQGRRLDDTVEIAADFFTLGHRRRIETLLAAMVTAAPSIAPNVRRPLANMILGMADVGLYGRRDT